MQSTARSQVIESLVFSADSLTESLVELTAKLSGPVIVTGGHFVIYDEIEINRGTELSFLVAVLAYKKLVLNGIQAGLGILINDMGATCSESSCSIRSVKLDKEHFELPGSYLAILRDQGLKLRDVEIYWEKHMRNRGQKELGKRLSTDPSLMLINGETWLSMHQNGAPHNLLLARKSPHCLSGTPACPLIMAGYALEQYRRGYREGLHYYYVGEDNFDNIPNHFNIEKGTAVAEHFEVPISCRNIYFTFDSIFTKGR